MRERKTPRGVELVKTCFGKGLSFGMEQLKHSPKWSRNPIFLERWKAKLWRETEDLEKKT